MVKSDNRSGGLEIRVECHTGGGGGGGGGGTQERYYLEVEDLALVGGQEQEHSLVEVVDVDYRP